MPQKNLLILISLDLPEKKTSKISFSTNCLTFPRKKTFILDFPNPRVVPVGSTEVDNNNDT